ncbi:putative NACHT and Ankyrin domain protein [Rosellinia necatrix]|uniref:Putative NACHT and Ankyrin domain protein n=1 Tax=Rosellinia necatrix TaxID=77044 RepID=A0A1W2TGQ3_ROSNE|nr:putative NACHT and Ankyrin domain protein [Rosellinia necatrix]
MRASTLSAGLDWVLSPGAVPLLASALTLLIIFNYVVVTLQYHRGRKSRGTGLPVPLYPALVPYFGNVVPLIFNSARFVRAATSYGGRLTSTAVTFMGIKLYLFQDRETIAKFMKHPDLCSPMSLYVFALRHFFGMPEKSLEVYRADESGPHKKPFPGTDSHFRIDYVLHQSFIRGWSGPGLVHTTRRFRGALQARADGLDISSTSWVQVPDIFQFLLNPVSASITESVFGPTLLSINPDFLDDLWAYDAKLPWMARGLPSFLMPAPYRIRDRLRAQIKRWQSHARDSFRESDIEGDGGDPFWGSELVRQLWEVLRGAGTHDDDALSAHHLGMIFAANFNLVPSAVVTMLQIILVPGLLQRVRDEMEANVTRSPSGVEGVEFRRLLHLPLLSSVYAEALRLHVKVFFFASSPRSEVSVGKWTLPRGSLGLINTDGPHTDERVWNTQNGRHPVDTFWAERFLVDPSDPSSGPVNPQFRAQECSERKRGGVPDKSPSDKSSKHFSTEGLEGSWIPYGGGPAICPGRFLAKNIILLTCALLISEFDFELVGDVEMGELDDWRYGLGVVRPKNEIPVRIRRRSARVPVWLS